MPRKGENVYHRKDGLWEARYVKEIDAFGKRKLGSVYARSYREVKEKRQEIVDNIRLNQIKPTTRNTTVVQLINEWLYINKDRLKPSSYQKYQGFLRKHIEPYLGKQPVMYFTTISIHQYSMDRIQNGVSPHTVNAVLAFIRSCLKYGHRQYGLPLPDVIYHAQIKKEMRVLTQEEQRKLTAYLLEDTDIYKFGVLLALYTGLRVGELCALEWDDITDGRIKVRHTMQRLQCDNGGTVLHVGSPKTKTSLRDVPIPSFLKDIIEEFRDRSAGQKNVLSKANGDIIEPRRIQDRFGKYTDDLGMENVTFHTLRHSFATRCVENNFEIKSLSEVLGHTNITTTLSRYVHSSFELKTENMEKLQLII